MTRTSVWLALSGIALLAAIWFVNGPLQGSVTPRDADASAVPAALVSPVPAPATPTAISPSTSRDTSGPGPLPASSVEDIFSMPHDFSQTHAAYALAAAAADGLAVEQLIADAQRVTRRGDRVALASIFIARYSEIDPRAAIEFIARTELESKTDLLYRVFEGWSKLDLGAAIAAAGDLGTPAEQQAAVAAILRAHADSGAGSVAMIMARLVAAGVSGNPQLNSAIQSVSGEPEAALAAAIALPRDQAVMLVSTSGMGWASQDPEAAFAYSRTMRDVELRRQMLNGVFYSWMDRDPGRVMGLLDEQLTADERNSLINAGLGRLAQRDPDQALELSLGIANFAYRETALQRTFRTWGDADPLAAAAALERIDSGNMAVLIKEVGPEYARRAPAEALEWAKRVSNGQPYPEVIAAVAHENLSLALDAALSIPGGTNRTTSMFQISASIAAENLATATDFWHQLPSEHRQMASQGIVSTLVRTDPDQAAGWIRSIPQGPDQQQALGELLLALSPSINITNYGQLLGMVDSSEQRDTYGWTRVYALVNSGHREQAEAELERLNLSPDGYRRALAAIERSELDQ